MSERPSATNAGKHARSRRPQRARRRSRVRVSYVRPRTGSRRSHRAEHVVVPPLFRRAGVGSVLATASLGTIVLAHGHLQQAQASAPAAAAPRFAAVSSAGTSGPPTAVLGRPAARSLAQADGPAALRTVQATSYAPDHLVRAVPGCPQPSAAAGFENGRIPASALCTLPDGQRLRSDAAAAWLALDAAYQQHFGTPVVVTDSYRDLATQRRLKKAKPVLGAVPGTSRHGRGIAVDLGGGVQTLGSEQRDWMLRHAPEYGWDNPAWARPGGSKPEPWHWEYTPPGQAGGADGPAHDAP